MRLESILTRRINRLIFNQMLHARKLEELLVYVSHHPGVRDLGLTKLWKLVYFIDAEALRSHGQTVTGSEYIKYEHGPVPSRGEKHLKALKRSGAVACHQRQYGGYQLNSVVARRPATKGVFSAGELELIDQICRRLGGKSAKQLSDLSHDEPAWHYAEVRQKLSPELMAYGMAEDPDGL